MAETPKAVYDEFADEKATFSDDGAYKSKGFKVAGKAFRKIDFKEISIGDFHRFCFEWIDASQWDAESAEWAQDRIQLCGGFPDGDIRTGLLREILLDNLYAIYGESTYTSREAVANPEKWPPALLKLMEVGLDTDWKAGSGKQSAWRSVGGDTVDQWARNILELHKLAEGGADISSTKVLQIARSFDEFEKTVLEYMDAFVKTGAHGKISEAQFYDIGEKKIGAPGHKLHHPVRWYIGDRDNFSELVGLLFVGQLWQINNSKEGLNGFALAHRWTGKLSGTVINVVKNTLFQEDSYFVAAAGAAGAPGIMAKDSGGGIRHRIFSGGTSPGMTTSHGILRNMNITDNNHYFKNPDILLKKKEGIQSRDMAGLGAWAKKIFDEVLKVTASTAVNLTFGLLGTSGATGVVASDPYNWGHRSPYFLEYVTLAWDKFSELVTTGAYLGKAKINTENNKGYYRSFWEEYVQGLIKPKAKWWASKRTKIKTDTGGHKQGIHWVDGDPGNNAVLKTKWELQIVGFLFREVKYRFYGNTDKLGQAGQSDGYIYKYGRKNLETGYKYYDDPGDDSAWRGWVKEFLAGKWEEETTDRWAAAFEKYDKLFSDFDTAYKKEIDLTKKAKMKADFKADTASKEAIIASVTHVKKTTSLKTISAASQTVLIDPSDQGIIDAEETLGMGKRIWGARQPTGVQTTPFGAGAVDTSGKVTEYKGLVLSKAEAADLGSREDNLSLLLSGMVGEALTSEEEMRLLIGEWNTEYVKQRDAGASDPEYFNPQKRTKNWNTAERANLAEASIGGGDRKLFRWASGDYWIIPETEFDYDVVMRGTAAKTATGSADQADLFEIMRKRESVESRGMGDPTGYGVFTQEQWYKQFASATAWVLSLSYLCWVQNAEALGVWKAALEVPEDTLPSEVGTTYDIGEIIRKAKEYDDELMDGIDLAKVEEDEEALSEKQIEERQVYLKQCALLLNMDKMKMAYQKELVARAGTNLYDNLIIPLDVEENNSKSKVMNKLVAPKTDDIAAFLKMGPDIQSALQPKIRLFKVFVDSADNENLKEVEIVFPHEMEKEDDLYSLRNYDFSFKGGACGIKDFTFKLEGTNPATARKDIQATLTLFFQNFKEFVRERHVGSLFGSKSGEKWRYVDLVLLPVSSKVTGDAKDVTHPFNYDPSDYRIRADIGWQIRRDIPFGELTNTGRMGKTFRKDLAKSLEKINKSFYLNRVGENIDFRNDGSVEITIDYQAYLESELRSNRLDALMTPELAKEKAIINEEHNTIISEGICDENKERYEEILATYSAVEEDFVKRAHRSITQRLLDRDLMHYCYLAEADRNEFAKNGFFFGKPKIYLPKEAIVEKTEEDFKITTKKKAEDDEALKKDATYKDVFLDSTLEKFITPPISKEGTLITFFYLGDLMHVALDCMRSIDNPNELLSQFKKTKILLAPFDYYDQQNNLKTININEIPIATEYFFEWMNQNVVKEDKRTYPITLFIRDICNKMIVELMQEICINKKAEKSIRFQTTNILGINSKITDLERFSESRAVNVSKAYKEGDMPFSGEISPGLTITHVENFFVVYPVIPIDGTNHSGVGDWSADGQEGIYHFVLGKESGILKNIKFNKTDIAYLREARFYQSGFNGLSQLGAVYNCTLELYGNTLFYPGMQIFIDPRNIGGTDFDPTLKTSTANFLGIGGYHQINRVECSLGPGRFNTTIEAQFIYSGDGAGRVIGVSRKDKAAEDKSVEAITADALDFTSATDDACSEITYLRQARLNEAEFAGTGQNFANLSEYQRDEAIKNISDKSED